MNGKPILEKKKIGAYERPWRDALNIETFSPKGMKPRMQRESSLTTSKDELMFLKQKRADVASLAIGGRSSQMRNDDSNNSQMPSL